MERSSLINKIFLSKWLAMGVIVIITFAAYSPALKGEFIWDDSFEIIESPLLNTPDGLKHIWLSLISDTGLDINIYYYPLTTTTFWLEKQLWGLDPMGYHIVNVAMHAINALLFWLLLRCLGVRWAWFAGIVFALHPVHVESVAWITERKNVLSGMMYLLTIGSFLRFVNRGKWRWYVGAIGLFVLTLLSKTSTVMLPVVLLLCLLWLKRSLRWKDICFTSPFFALSAGAAVSTIWLEQRFAGAKGAEWSAGIMERIAIAGRIVWFYLGKILMPYNLTFIYPRWTVDPRLVSSYLPTLALLVLFAIFWLKRTGWGKPMLIGLGYFFVSLFPVLGFFNVYFMRYSFVADHFQYLASMGVIALVIGGMGWEFERRGLNQSREGTFKGYVLGLIVVLVFGTLTWSQAHIYQNEETLWRDTIDKNPDAWIARNNIGVIYKDRGQLKEAIREFQMTLELKPDHAGAHNNLGLVYFKQGKIEDAINEYLMALELKPNHAGIHNNLGFAYFEQGRIEDVLKEFQTVVRIEPGNVDAYYNLGVIYQEKGMLSDAIIEYKKVLTVNYSTADVHNNLGVIYTTYGLIDQAIHEFQEALMIDPDFEKAKGNLKDIMKKKIR